MTELDKWDESFEDYKTLTDFIEFLNAKGIQLGKWSEDYPDFMIPTMDRSDDLIYKFLDIDYQKLDKERGELLKSIQSK